MPRLAHGSLVAALLACVTLGGCPAAEPQGDPASARPASDQPAAAAEPATTAEPTTAAGPVTAAEPAPATASPLAEQMRDHFGKAAQVEFEVIDGALDNAKAEARALHEMLTKMEVPEPWRPHVDRMLTAADEVANAKDLVVAATATGHVLHSCGTCHRAIGGGPKYGEPTPVPEGETTAARMARHAWAAARMREGMIGPSDERWLAGAKSISVAPPEPCPIPSDDILPKEVLDLREKIYELGAKAVDIHDADARAALYGEYLTTCAGCHVGGC